MRDSQPTHLETGGSWQDNEEQAWRLWTASARRAAVALQHKRFAAAEIYWRSAFELALRHLQAAGRSVFTPVHVLEPLQGLAGLFIEQGKWMAARSLFNEVSEFFQRQNIVVTGMAERLFNAIAQRIAQAQRQNPVPAADNVEELPLAVVKDNSRPARSAMT